MSADRYTDAEMLNALRAVAGALGGRPMSGPVYQRARGAGRPTRQSVQTRFGSWRAAMAVAGLETPTVAGGLTLPCVVCGAAVPTDRGAKSRRTCSSACYAARRAEQRREGAISAQGSRGRARQDHLAASCARCGATDDLEVHHRDRDPFNNDAANLETLCRTCHNREHGRLVEPRECQACAASFTPRRRSGRFCSKRCAGRWSRRPVGLAS